MRTDALRRIGGYHPEFEPAEDYDLLLRLGEVGELANLPDYLYEYRMHPEQVTVQKYELQQRAMREAQSLACQRRRVAPPAQVAFVHPRPSRIWQTYIVWAECALRAGYRAAAWKHAWGGLRRRPWSRTAWKTVLRVGLIPPRPDRRHAWQREMSPLVHDREAGEHARRA
jgi:hypothetical protein